MISNSKLASLGNGMAVKWKIPHYYCIRQEHLTGEVGRGREWNVTSSLITALSSVS